jgi:hypothetical protein
MGGGSDDGVRSRPCFIMYTCKFVSSAEGARSRQRRRGSRLGDVRIVRTSLLT